MSQNKQTNRFHNWKNTKFAGMAVTLSILVLVIAVVLNMIVSRLDFSWDISPNKQYSLSSTTEKYLDQLDSEIVMAKFLATATILLIMLAASLFYPIITSIYGRVIWSSLICTYIGFFLFGLVCIALGIFISSLTEMPLLAILLSELAMLMLILMDNLSVNSFLSGIPVLSDVLSWFSNRTKFYVFSQGLMQFSDLLGYVTEIAVFLIWTIISIEKRRWSRR